MFVYIFYALAAFIGTVYYLSRRKFNYWKKQNVPYLKPTAILGNYGDFILLKKHIATVITELCDKMPNEPYFGVFYGTEPTLMVRDPEILKLITTKDFYYFNGREISKYVHKEAFTQSIVANYGDEWKVIRQNLTPVFTSAKMKNMFHLITECAYKFENLLQQDSKVSNVFDVRPLITRFTMACIVSCGFGVDSNTLGEGLDSNPFTNVGRSFFAGVSKFLAVKAPIRSIWPGIFYFLGMSVNPPGTIEFFSDFISNVFKARNYKPTSRNDFIDFILNYKEKGYLAGDSISNLKTGDNKKVNLPLTEDLMIAQCMTFFLAGFETSATTTSFTLFELSKNKEAQKKVQEEIDNYLKKYDNKITYDIVNELTYTWACVEETLRFYPVLPFLTREVMEDYTLPTGVHLEKGIRIHIPLQSMHRDPKYFPEPEVYRPERFFGEERRKIVSHSYLPFGEGARICLGVRFAKMQVLAGLVTVLKRFNIELNEQTKPKVEYNRYIILPLAKDPLLLNFSDREGWEGRQYVKP